MLPLLLTALLFGDYRKDVDSAPILEARTALKDNLFTRALHYMESNPETLDELLTKNYALMEGDVILLSDRNAVERRWPTPEIPYVISPEIASRTGDILSAMAMLSEHTCVSFHQRTSETNYLNFTNNRGCSSYVGLIGGKQPVFVGPPCIVGNIVHEILHALGFHHEHTRMDRKQHITILHHNIMTGMEKNFNKHQGQTFKLPYDITSIMHYGGKFFSANGLPTIVSKSDVKDMGQRVKLTEMDIKRVGRLYGCDTTEKKLAEEESSVVTEEKDANTYVPFSDVASAGSTCQQAKGRDASTAV